MPTTQSTTILQAVSTDREHGRPIPDAATGEIIGYAPVHTVTDSMPRSRPPVPRSRPGRRWVTQSAAAS